MDKLHFFDFETRMWSHKNCHGGLFNWSFGHAHKRGRHLIAYGTPAPIQSPGHLEVSPQNKACPSLGKGTLKQQRVSFEGSCCVPVALP